MKMSKPKLKRIDPLEPLKMEIAAELGLLNQINSNGWHSLTAKEAGKIGGLMTQRQRKKQSELGESMVE